MAKNLIATPFNLMPSHGLQHEAHNDKRKNQPRIFSSLLIKSKPPPMTPISHMAGNLLALLANKNLRRYTHYTLANQKQWQLQEFCRLQHHYKSDIHPHKSCSYKAMDPCPHRLIKEKYHV